MIFAVLDMRVCRCRP